MNLDDYGLDTEIQFFKRIWSYSKDYSDLSTDEFNFTSCVRYARTPLHAGFGRALEMIAFVRINDRDFVMHYNRHSVKLLDRIPAKWLLVLLAAEQ